MNQVVKKIIIMAFFLTAFIASNQTIAASVVDTNSTYTYETMKKDLAELDETYGDLIELYTIGQSVYGRDIVLVRLGNGQADTFYNGSHHAREWLTTILNMKMIESYAEAAEAGTTIEGYDVRSLLEKGTLWFVPMVNPDGVTLQQKGLQAFPKDIHKSLISMNNGSSNFDRWKANVQGIDLNRQYPSGWEEVSTTSPSWKNYKGEYPFQAPEAKVMRDLTYLLNPAVSLAYHTSGRVIYWNFNVDQEDLGRDQDIAELYASLSGYRMVPTYAGSGYTDWINEVFDRPSLTPELGLYAGERHVDPATFPETWRRNKEAGLAMANESVKLQFPEHTPGDQPVVLGDRATERDILPPRDIDDYYEKALDIMEDYHLSQEESIEYYSWYQQCKGDCSINDPELNEVFDKLLHFEDLPEQKDIEEDKTWTIELNTHIDPESVNKDNVYIQTTEGQAVPLEDAVVEDNFITVHAEESYRKGKSYTIYVKDLISAGGQKMEEPVEMTFTIQ
ncbi:gamma-D-glutamyl-meso-diaminopimelate peptidase [Pontibacillus chungwhensis BH030062]|uniref:Gamma-D-glutamyl-meso-diaminopimelate peptidase n=1 Tax=Pontibacillus chungwhensis BH030062 TaxID=1385513 RepID=A0A0A2VBZ4_9BACI|nr:M14 family zinc carboxypeptidase [Pontibacillus chungwhensis]KGP91190.1 gamma-D-glutamyl-meso-diaminopimelate peptidase [Pontibacillus chungwhensis BH030062]